MTPTLFGRWQTRLFLLATAGGSITLLFALGILGPGAGAIYFGILAYVALFGLAWDVFYNRLQQGRWDRDWPAAFQWLAALGEALFLLLVIKIIGLPGVPRWMPVGLFFLHYSCVWLAVFLTSQSLMRILFIRWRFNGGRWL
ncbi:hypothetical protein QQ056_12035 [Oscillatoria laete-virens NRMC-F 0139]|nr:hypothetical protein [Oscillatoria laete-virens]MDI9636177.1 hypothetical protein [Geitlerinema splendidum]MDL5054274.1 hypothetical protein [Oscillatoria laete-virens NRMC-F 0139]